MPKGIYIRTEEHNRKIGLANAISHKGKKRKPFSEETKRKMKGRVGRKKGFKHLEETKRKMSKSHEGERSSFWKGGISYEPYSTDWTATLKRAIRERDNYICQICSKYGNYVHHKNYDKKNCNPDNLITLCKKCHAKTNLNRNYWLKYFGIKNK